MVKQLVERTSFAAGEVSPALYARRELAAHAIGVARCENMVTLIEGVLTRRPGTRFVLPYKNENQNAAVIRFRHTPADGYLLVINNQTLRVIKDGGFLESSPGTIYELGGMPWLSADLPNLRAYQVGSSVYIACTGFQTYVLTRGATHISWSLAPYLPNGGPVGIQNVDQSITITSSAVTGNVTLSGVNTDFQSADIGGVFRLDEPDLTKVPQWTPNEILSSPLTFISQVGLTRVTDFTNNPNAPFDAVTSQASAASGFKSTGATAYIGSDLLGGPGAQPIAKARVYGSNNFGFYGGSNATISIRLMAKAASPAPANGLDGVELGRITFTDTDNESAGRDIYSNDPLTFWRYVWVYIEHPGAGAAIVAEFEAYRYTLGASTNRRRYNGRVYLALNDGDTGTNPPTHEEGDARSGANNINWRFLHNTYGLVRINSWASTTQILGTVISRLPESVVEGPTYRWWPPAWSPRVGWPDRIGGHDGRLIFGRKDEAWITRPSDLNSVEVLNITGDAADPDSGIAFRLRPRKSELPWIEWILSAGVVILGLRDSERVVRAPQLFDPLAIDKLRAIPGSKEGSAAHDPADVDDGVIFIGRSRRRLHYADFDNLNAKMTAAEITKSARHILAGRAAYLAWQRDPNRICWIACQDGSLIGLTFMPEDKVVAFHRHPTTNGFVEWVASVPSADESSDEVYLGVRRIINGATRRYIERLQDFFAPLNADQPTAAGAWFVDCGLSLSKPTAVISGATQANPVVITSNGHPFANGASVKIAGVNGMTQLNGVIAQVANKTANTYQLAGVDGTGFSAYTSGGVASEVVSAVAGLDHLEGQTVRVFADGAQQSDKLVTGGSIALDAHANSVVVGLPLKWFVRSLPFDLDTPAGSTKGQEKNATHVVIETVYSAGGDLNINPGKIGVSGGKTTPLTGTGSLDYDAPVPLLTDLKRYPVSTKSGPRCFIELTGDNALPFTLAGMHPELEAKG